MFPKSLTSLCFSLVLLSGCTGLSVDTTSQRYTTEIVAADPDAGFNYPYILRQPTSPIAEDHRYIIVESNNDGADDDYQKQIEKALTSAGGWGLGPNLATKLNTPLVIPVFPRTKIDWRTYTHALDRDTLLLKHDARQRLDLQLISMVEDARRKLELTGTDVSDKFVLVGFSASGTFSNRFAFLHPEKLLAVVSGAVNSFPMLPIESIKGETLDYPLGIADIEAISGNKFNAPDWRALPQMIFMGADDKNDAVMADDAYSPEERKIILEHVGRDMASRWSAAQSIYLQQQPNVSFTTYGQIGHGTDGRVNGDILNFVEIVMRRASLEVD